MHKLEKIADQIRQKFDLRNAKRDQALAQARRLTRACSLAIRAVHRDDKETMEMHLAEAGALADTLRQELVNYPELFFAGYPGLPEGIRGSQCDLCFDSESTASDSRGAARRRSDLSQRSG